MKVVFEVDKKSLALAKAVLLQSADDEEKERLIEDACSRCEGDVTVSLSADELGSEESKQISLGLAFIAIGKMVSDPKESARKHHDEMKADTLDALRICGNDRSEAARMLGISERTLYRRMKQFGII